MSVKKSLDQKAFDNGWNGYLRGASPWANPYRGDGLRFMWDAGWRDSKEAARARILKKNLKG